MSKDSDSSSGEEDGVEESKIKASNDETQFDSRIFTQELIGTLASNSE